MMIADWVYVTCFIASLFGAGLLAWIAGGCPGLSLHYVVREQPRQFLWPLPPQTTTAEPPKANVTEAHHAGR